MTDYCPRCGGRKDVRQEYCMSCLQGYINDAQQNEEDEDSEDDEKDDKPVIIPIWRDEEDKDE